MKNLHILALSVFFSLVFVSSCKNDDNVGVECNAFHWEYAGVEGPDAWSTCFDNCGGQSQSPIAITGDVADANMTALETHYEEVPINLVFNGHTLEFEYEAGSELRLNGEDYALLQFHFHTSSEHTINGTRYPMEAHLVHKNSDGALAVVGIMFEEGAENAFLKNFSSNLPTQTDQRFTSATKVNVRDLIPATGGYFTYSGSLTTPPCSEIVTWMVMKTPVEASATQIANFHSIMRDNFRPTQAINGRSISDYDCGDFHWAYEGHNEPSSWTTCFDHCGGDLQSLINITSAVADGTLPLLNTQYEHVPIGLIHNGHTVEFEYEVGSRLTLNGVNYELLQFHFHTGSEHTVNGVQYPMEVHLVHKNSAGSLAVIGIFIEEGAENAFLKNFSDNLPSVKGAEFTSATEINVEDLLPTNRSYYTYSGSLTTPPCSEIVTWLVLKTPVQASSTQIKNMHDIIQDNFRPVQALNGRTIKEFL